MDTGLCEDETETLGESVLCGARKHERGLRVDRLRLLGNGVVPAQAELAFRILIERFATVREHA